MLFEIVTPRPTAFIPAESSWAVAPRSGANPMATSKPTAHARLLGSAVTSRPSDASRTDQDLQGLASAHQLESSRHVAEPHLVGDQRGGIKRAVGEQRHRPADEARGVMEHPQEAQFLVVDPA